MQLYSFIQMHHSHHPFHILMFLWPFPVCCLTALGRLGVFCAPAVQMDQTQDRKWSIEDVWVDQNRFFFSQDIQMWKNTKPGMTLRHYNVLVYWQRLCKKGVEHPDLTNMRRNSQLTDIMASFFPKRFRCAHISTCWSFRALHSHVALDRKRPVRNTMLEHRQHKNKCQSS